MQRTRLEAALLALVDRLTRQQVADDASRHLCPSAIRGVGAGGLRLQLEQSLQGREVGITRQMVGQQVERRRLAARLGDRVGEAAYQWRTGTARGEPFQQVEHLVLTAELAHGLDQGRQDLGDVGRTTFGDPLEECDRPCEVSRLERREPLQHGRTHAGRIGRLGVAQVLLRRDRITFALGLLGQLAVILGDGDRHRLASEGSQTLDQLETSDPIAFLLVDIEQRLERALAVQTQLGQFEEEVFRAVEQAGAQIVLTQLEECETAPFGRQILARDQILMDTDGTIDLATTAEQCAERQMGLECVAVDICEFEEEVDRLVRLFLEQIVQAAQKIGMGRAGAVAPGPRFTPGQPPPGSRGHGKQQKQQLDHAPPLHAWARNRRRGVRPTLVRPAEDERLSRGPDRLLTPRIIPEKTGPSHSGAPDCIRRPRAPIVQRPSTAGTGPRAGLPDRHRHRHMFDLAQQTVVITGATGNLGQAVAARFAAAGARLALVGRDPDRLGAVRERLGPAVEVAVHTVDLLRPEEVSPMIEAVSARFGGLHALVNLAGGFGMGPAVHETTDADWEQMFDLNTRTTINVIRAVVPRLLAGGGGRIVNCAARAATHGSARMAPYCVAKAAIVTLTESLADELKHQGINVNCVLPGTLDTPQNRAAMPDQDPADWVQLEALADVILFLVSDGARAINGAAIPVYGRG